MGDLKLFWSFVQNAKTEIQINIRVYIGAIFALILLGNFDTVFHFMGVTDESNLFILLSVLTTLATFIVLSKVVLIQKISHGGSGELKYIVTSFLLYNLYYSFLFFAGLLFLFVPGLYVLIFFSMAPFVAILDDECKGSYFTESKILVKKNIKLVAIASFVNLLVEFSSLVTAPIQNSTMKSFANFCLSIPYAFITVVMTVAFVKIYYYLKKPFVSFE